MSIFDERFVNHEIHENIISTKKRYESLIADSSDADVLEYLDRLLQVTIHVESNLNKSASLFIPESTLNQLNKILNNINSDVSAFDSSKEISHLVTANSRADNLIIHLQQLPQVETPSDLSSLSEQITKFHKSIDNVLASINKKREQAETALSTISERVEQINSVISKHDQTIENQKGRLDSAISQIQTQFSEAEDRRRESYEKETQTRQDDFQKIRADIENNFITFSNERKQEVDTAISEYGQLIEKNIKELEDKTSALTKANEDKANTLFQSHEDMAKDTITFLTQKKEEASKLLNIIGNIGFTGNYNKIADAERLTANVLRITSIFFMILGVLAIGTMVFSFTTDEFKWGFFFSRIALTAIILIPAFYCAKESNRHRQREILNRKMELELASIGPYLELLPDDKKDELKAKLSEKLFGQPDITKEKGEIVTATSLFSLLEKVVTNLTKK